MKGIKVIIISIIIAVFHYDGATPGKQKHTDKDAADTQEAISSKNCITSCPVAKPDPIINATKAPAYFKTIDQLIFPS